MKGTLLFVATAMWFVAQTTFAAPEPAKESARTKAGLYVTPIEAYEMLTSESRGKAVLVDVRDPVEIMFTGYTELTDIHVPLKIIDPSVWDEKSGSYQATTNRDFVAETVAALTGLGADKNTPIIFMCRSGATRSAPAADALYDAGYKNVYTIVGGFEGGKAKSGEHQGARVVDGWKNSGLPWGWKLDAAKMYRVPR